MESEKDGQKIATIISGTPIVDDKGTFQGSFAVITDITEQKKMEQVLRGREKELAYKTVCLQETNTALKVLLEQTDQNRKEIEEKVLLNVRGLVLPYVEKIKNSQHMSGQLAKRFPKK